MSAGNSYSPGHTCNPDMTGTLHRDERERGTTTQYQTISLPPSQGANKAIFQPSSFPTLLLLLASLFFSGMHSGVRYTTTEYDTSPLFVAFFRGSFQALCAVGLICACRDMSIVTTLTPRVILLLCFRGVLGAISICCKYVSLSLIPVAVASSLFCTTPIIAVVLGSVLLGERLTSADRIALWVTVAAAVLVAASQDMHDISAFNLSHVYGVLLALTGAAATGSVLVTVRAMGSKAHFLLSVMTLGLGASIGSFIVDTLQRWSLAKSMSYWSDKFLLTRWDEWIALASVGIFSLLAALCTNRAAQMVPAGRAGLMRTLDIPLNFAVGFLVLGEFPTSWGQLLGCAMIAGSTGLLAVKSFLES